MEEKPSTETQLPCILHVSTNRHTVLVPSTSIFKKKRESSPSQKYSHLPLPLITSKRLATRVLYIVRSRAMGCKFYSINYRPTELYKMNNINLKRHPWQHTACSTHMTLEVSHPIVSNFLKKKLQKRQKDCLILEYINKKIYRLLTSFQMKATVRRALPPQLSFFLQKAVMMIA